MRVLTIKLVDGAIGCRLVGAVDEGVTPAFHEYRSARKIVHLEKLPERALVAVRR